MIQWPPVFKTIVLGNTIEQYLLTAILAVSVLFILGIVKKVLFSRLKKITERTPSKHDDFAVMLAEKNLYPLLYLGAFYLVLIQLTLDAGFLKAIHVLGVTILTLQMTRFLLSVSIYVLEHTWLRRETVQGGTTVSKSILTFIRIGIWGVALVFLFDNLGFNVSAIVAGLGIGGVAVALAAQTILGDLFNYFVIFFDRPFEEGDFIIIDNTMGVIENIGIKSTRIRSLDGEQIVISNTNLTNSRIRNFKRMAQRRVLFSLGVVYETPSEKLEKIPAMIRAIIEKIPETKFDRAHFKQFADYSLVIEVVYYALSADYNTYMDIQQKINFAIKQTFEQEQIEFAYPTQLELQKHIS